MENLPLCLYFLVSGDVHLPRVRPHEPFQMRKLWGFEDGRDKDQWSTAGLRICSVGENM